MAEQKTYRHAKTGVVAEYPPSLARQYPDLVEVEPGTKPLAYTPIPQVAIDALRASTSESDTDPDPEEDEA